jgi:hypothetical protein
MTSPTINPALILAEPPYLQLFNNGPTHPFRLPDQLKNTFIAGIIQNNLLNNTPLDIPTNTTQQCQGNNPYLDLSCPTTQQYLIFMQLAELHLDPKLMKEQLTTEFYLVKEDDLKKKIAHSISNNTPTTISTLDNISAKSHQKQPPPGSYPTVTHQNFALAKESLGPMIYSKRKSTGSWTFLPPECHGAEYHCKFPDCEARWIIYGVSTELDCSPAHLRSNGKAHNHVALTWADYYNSQVKSRDNKARGHTSDLDNQSTQDKPGLPPVFQLTLGNILRANTGITPILAARAVIEQLRTHILLKESNEVMGMIMEQIKRQFKHKKQIINNEFQDTLEIVWDVEVFAKKYSINFLSLAATEYLPKPPEHEKEVESLAIWFYENRILQFKTPSSVFNHKSMFVLRHPEVENDSRIKKLIQSKSHQTGNYPLRTTLVLTTFAMLSTIADCERNDWLVQASADGTHNISSDNGFLTCLFGFGCVSIAADGTRQWRPVAFGAGEGEREILALITFLNVKLTCRDLFGIEIKGFKGGLVSDHSSAIVNAFKYCFPTTNLLQCYTHILRKFLHPKDRNDNGQYRKHLSNKDTQSTKWLYSTAMNDIRNLHSCRSQEQFQRYAEMVDKAWTEMGEGSLSKIFQNSYIRNDSFNKWWSTSSGVPGYSPDNNPLESFHKVLKGSKDFRGIVDQGKPYQKVINEELPRLLWWISSTRVGISSHYPILQEDTAFNDKDVRELLKGFQWDIDSLTVTEQVHGIDGWLVNDWKRLNQPITSDDTKKYVRYIQGDFQMEYQNRQELVEFVNKFHHMEEISDPKLGQYFQCSCVHFYKKRYCPLAAMMQHRLTLISKGKSLGTRPQKRNPKRTRFEEIVQCVRKVRDSKTSTVVATNENLDTKPPPVPALTQDD